MWVYVEVEVRVDWRLSGFRAKCRGFVDLDVKRCFGG